MIVHKFLTTFGRYSMLMGRTFSRPERLRVYWKQYVKEMAALGVDSIGIVLIISFATSGGVFSKIILIELQIEFRLSFKAPDFALNA